MSKTFIRVLVCKHCKTLEVLPDFEGRPEHDTLLAVLLERHQAPGHGENAGNLLRIEEQQWNNYQSAIEKEIRDALGGGLTGFEAAYYHAKDTFKEDAFTCWGAHNKNPVCPDYKTEKKLLKPGAGSGTQAFDTSKDRKDLGIAQARTKVYLCDFCPVKSVIQEKHFEKLGYYDK